MGLKIGELFVTLGIDADSKAAKEFIGDMNTAMFKAVGLVAALTGVSIGFRELYLTAIQSAIGIQQFSNQTQLSADQLQQWQFIGQQVNVSADEVSSSIQGIQQSIAQIRLGGGNIVPFSLFKINVDDSPFEILDKLRGRIKMFDRPVAISLLEQMGLSANMINILDLTNNELEKLNKNKFIVSEADRINILEVKRAMEAMQIAVAYFGSMLTSKISPAVVGFIDLLVKLPKIIYWAKDALISMIGVWALFKSKMIAAFAASVIANPIAQIITLLGFLILILDDVYGYFHGKDSLTGGLVQGLKDIFLTLQDSASMFFEYIFSKFDELIEKIAPLKVALNSIKSALTISGLGMTSSGRSIAEDVVASQNSGKKEGLILDSLFKSIVSASAFGPLHKMLQGISINVPKLSLAGNIPSMGVGKIIKQNNIINISTSESPIDVGNQVRMEIERQAEIAAFQFNNQGK